MRFTTVFLAALSSASFGLASEEVQPSPTVSAPEDSTTTPPEIALQEYLEHGNNLELRQATDVDNAATQAVTQMGAVTTFYMASAIGTTDTWVPFIYTQSFADVPDPLPSPQSGAIGYGTLVKQNKRDAEPEPTGDSGTMSGLPLVLELRNVVVIQPVHPAVQITKIIELPLEWTGNVSMPYQTQQHENQSAMSITNTTTAHYPFGTGPYKIFPSELNPAEHPSLPVHTVS